MGDGYRIPRYDARCRMQSLGGATAEVLVDPTLSLSAAVIVRLCVRDAQTPGALSKLARMQPVRPIINRRTRATRHSANAQPDKMARK